MPIITEDKLTGFDPTDFSTIGVEVEEALQEDWKAGTVDE